ncbi:MAG: hypothetical protein GY817_08230 [bacterium]|nr:hypothetical protein [bacterium]
MIKKHYLLFLLLFFLMISFLFSSDDIYNSEKYFEYGDLSIDYNLEMKYTTNRLNDNWERMGTNKYSKNELTGDSAWIGSDSQNFSMESYLNLNSHFKGMILFEVYNGGYDSLWRPVNNISRIESKNQYLELKQAELNYNYASYKFKYFKGIPRNNWKYSGDMFNFLPAQYESDRYLNIAGKAIPEGLQFDSTDLFGGFLNVIYGEPVWGKSDSLYVKYRYSWLFYFDSYFLYKYEKIPWKVSYGDDYQQAYQFSTAVKHLFPFSIQLGVSHNPFRNGRGYQHVQEVGKGSGYQKSKYVVNNSTTTDSDTFGYALNIDYENEEKKYNIHLTGEYLNILAGNKKELSLKFLKSFYFGLLFNIDATYREPIIAANPVIYNYQLKDSSGVEFASRGESSPFRVDNSNRKCSIVNIGFSWFQSIYNPELLYKYDVGLLEGWNINKEDNTSLAVALNYKLKHYQGSADGQYYDDDSGNIVWDSPMALGLMPFKVPLETMQFLIKGRLSDKLSYLFIAQRGDSIATGSAAYEQNLNSKKVVTFNDFTTRIGYKTYFLDFEYKENYWGPEEWHRFFGLTYDNLFSLEIGKDFGKFGVFSIDTMKVIQNNPDIDSTELPSFEEFTLKWTYNFSRIYALRNDGVSKKSNSLENDNKAPEVEVYKNIDFLSVNDDGLNDSVEFTINAKDDTAIERWIIKIESESGELIYKKEGLGLVPSYFEWGGRPYEILSEGLDAGIYQFKVYAVDVFGNFVETTPLKFRVSTAESILTKDLYYKMKDRVKVKIEEDYNKIIFSFDLDTIYSIEKGSVNISTLSLLKNILYSKELYKIKIITYLKQEARKNYGTSFARKISARLAQELVSYGIDINIINPIGFMKKDKNLKDSFLEIVCYY